MATDAAKHTVPAGTDHPARSDFLKLSLSIRDPIPVASVAARTAVLAALAASTPAVTPSTSNPVYFHRADATAGMEYERTVDGTTFDVISVLGPFAASDHTVFSHAPGKLATNTTTGVPWISVGGAWQRADGADTGWTALTLSNSWANFGGAWETAGYRRIGQVVYVRGLIKSGVTTTGTVITSLPAGFRPAADFMAATAMSTAGVALLDVLSGGNILVRAANNAFTSIKFEFPLS